MLFIEYKLFADVADPRLVFDIILPSPTDLIELRGIAPDDPVDFLLLVDADRLRSRIFVFALRPPADDRLLLLPIVLVDADLLRSRCCFY